MTEAEVVENIRDRIIARFTPRIRIYEIEALVNESHVYKSHKNPDVYKSATFGITFVGESYNPLMKVGMGKYSFAMIDVFSNDEFEQQLRIMEHKLQPYLQER